MTDGLHEVSLAHTHAAIEEKRVVGFGGTFGDSLAGGVVIALLGGQVNRSIVVPEPRLLKRAGQGGGAQLGEDEPFVERPAHPVEPGDPRLPGRDEIAGRCGVGCLEGKVGVDADEVERLAE